jgi:putative protease
MIHMEHCVYCAFLSPGTDKTNCGRPCDHHDVKLKDRTGVEHPLKADVGCRNTLYNAVPQTAAVYLPSLIAHWARHLRIEFLDDEAAAVGRTISLYRDVLDGKRAAKMLWRDLRATGKYGVTRGPLIVLLIRPGKDSTISADTRHAERLWLFLYHGRKRAQESIPFANDADARFP